MTANEQTLRHAITAIQARIHGNWDHPTLVQFGALSTDTPADILDICRAALLQLTNE